jgi:predicted RNA-binding Zn-ribbon protein involved in translation (DUF1610 family)
MGKVKAFSGFFRNIKWHLSQGKNNVLACPKCGSRNIELSSRFDAWLMPKRYICRDCGYIGPLVLEVEVEE